jgi:hypothetical protein
MTTLPDGGDLGFRIVSGVLDPGDASHLLRMLEASPLTRSRAGARHLMKHPAVSDVANDPRLLAIASGFLGPSAVPYRATLFDKSSERNWLVTWHQDVALPLQDRRDVPGWSSWSIKSGITYAHAPATALSRVVALRLHFDDSRENNGPLRLVARGDNSITLQRFLDETGLELEDVYTGRKTFSDLREDAGLSVEPSGPHEEILRQACARLLHIDDFLRIDTYRRFLSEGEPTDLASLSLRERLLARMLVAPVADRAINKTTTLKDACEIVWGHPQVRAELLDLIEVLATRVDHVQQTLVTHPDVPLQVHARYSRIEILAAFGIGEHAKVAPWQTGVYWAKDAGADLLAFTLDKTSGQFSPTTRYRDYAISRDLIHWESQSGTRADSEPGQRYQRHETLGASIMLFARLRSDDRAFWFLGPATYVKHESELPMAVTWRLDHSLPGDLFAQFAAAVA